MAEGTTIGATTFTTPTDQEIVITRVFDAPRTLVWEAVTQPEHVPRWYGPRGWTLPVLEMDLRPGGTWRHVMRSPEGRDLGMSGVYREVSPPERLVTTESFDDFPGESLNTLTLTEEQGGTRITVSVLYPSKEIRDAVLQSGMREGASQTYDRMDEHIQELSNH